MKWLDFLLFTLKLLLVALCVVGVFAMVVFCIGIFKPEGVERMLSLFRSIWI